jgi:hypothetical protein
MVTIDLRRVVADQGRWVGVSDPGVGLAKAIAAIRDELQQAQREGRGQSPSFAVGKVVVELGGELKATGGAGAGVKFWVVNVDAKGERSAAATHKVTVELIPKGPDGDSFDVHSQSPNGPTPE